MNTDTSVYGLLPELMNTSMNLFTKATKKHLQEGQSFAQNRLRKLLSAHRTLVKISPELRGQVRKRSRFEVESNKNVK